MARSQRFAAILIAFLPGCSGCETPSESEPGVQDATRPAATQPQTPGASDESPTSRETPRESANPATIESDASAAPPAHHEKKTTSSGALQQAQALHREARRHVQQGEVGTAYRQTSQAWQIVNQFPQDAHCAELAEKLLAEMETLGDQANRKFDAENNTQPLIAR